MIRLDTPIAFIDTETLGLDPAAPVWEFAAVCICHTCGNDLMGWNGNMTSNLSRMWDDAGAELREFDGKTAVQVIPKLQAALDNLRDDPDRYRKMNPENGWGTYENCVEYLERILRACCRDPYATLRVSL